MPQRGERVEVLLIGNDMPHETAGAAPALTTVDLRIQDGLFRARAAATARAYWREWLEFAQWCRARGLAPMPADEGIVVQFLGEISPTLALSSLHRKLAAISCAHALCELPSPTLDPLVREAVSHLRRRAGRERLSKAGLSPDDIARIVTVIPRTLQGDRDRCLILLGYATSLRRSDLASLLKADIDEREDSITIRVTRAGINRENAASILVPRNTRADICPVTAYRRWVDASGINEGPLFRWVTRHGQVRGEGLSDKAVAIIVKRAVARVGKDPSQFAANSLRRTA